MVNINKIMGVFSYPWSDVYSDKIVDLYRRALWLKANPRSEEYMKSLFLGHFPNGIYINADKDSEWESHISSADTVFLLYPDSIGVGFSKLESIVFKKRKIWAAVRILNGRKREFLLDKSTRRQLHLRRFLERWMLGESLAMAFFVVITPFILMFDWVRGRV